MATAYKSKATADAATDLTISLRRLLGFVVVLVIPSGFFPFLDCVMDQGSNSSICNGHMSRVDKTNLRIKTVRYMCIQCCLPLTSNPIACQTACRTVI